MVAGGRRDKDDRKQNALATIVVFFQTPFYGKSVDFFETNSEPEFLNV
jgi:hypothetical protein